MYYLPYHTTCTWMYLFCPEFQSNPAIRRMIRQSDASSWAILVYLKGIDVMTLLLVTRIRLWMSLFSKRHLFMQMQLHLQFLWLRMSLGILAHSHVVFLYLSLLKILPRPFPPYHYCSSSGVLSSTSCSDFHANRLSRIK